MTARCEAIVDREETRKAIELAARTAAPLYRLFGWTWAADGGGVPTEQRIVRLLREIAGDAEDQARAAGPGRWGECGSGRLAVRVWFDDTGAATLRFLLELGEVSAAGGGGR